MLRTATLNDAFELAPNLRAADKAELEAMGFNDIEMALVESLVLSDESMAYELDGKVVAVAGVVSQREFGVPWLLGSEELFSCRKGLIQHPQEYIPRWLAKYGSLFNIVHAENHRSIRWLRFLGFTIGETREYNGHLFHPFSMRKPDVSPRDSGNHRRCGFGLQHP